MGHLVNPIALRLGSTLSWETVWYIKFLYYTEFVHIMLRIKPFLSYFFNNKELIKGIIYSHYTLKVLGKDIIVKIFVYCSCYEANIFTIIDSFYSYKYRWKKMVKKKYTHYGAWKFEKKRLFLYSAFVLFFFLRRTGFPKRKKYRRLSSKIWLKLRKGRIKHINIIWLLSNIIDKNFNVNYDYLRRKILKKNKLKKKYLHKFYFCLYLFKSIKFTYKKSKRKYNMSIMQKGVGIFLYFTELLPFYKGLALYLENILNILCLSKLTVKCKMNRIRNKNVTGQFIAYFIGKKLKLGYPLIPLIKNLKREFARQKGIKRLKPFKNPKSESILSVVYKGYFKSLYIYVKKLYNRHFYNFYKNNNTLISLDYIILIYNLLKKRKTWRKLNYKFLIFLLKYRFGMAIFGNRQNGYLLNYFNLTYSRDILLYSPLINMQSTYYMIHINHINNVLNVDNWYNLSNNILKYVKILNNQIYYTYNIFGYLKKGKQKNPRRRCKYKVEGFRGYKMSFRGRFTRKQRAASININSGKVPLNTIGTFIDYGFSTVPIVNSAVSIKVWFYRK